MDSLWIGWPGDLFRFDSAQRARIENQLRDLRTVPVHLTASEISRYYEGFSNSVLWPLFHYITDKIQRDAWKSWRTFMEVNWRFAQSVSEQYRPGDLIWVHDYQLALVPGILRRLIPDARIGFFLHIPFPSSEVFRILPWRAEILRGLLGADLVGFHTHSYLRHFERTVLHVLNLESDGERIFDGDRQIRLGVFPMGVDFDYFSRLASDPAVVKEFSYMREKSGERKLIVGVDRLDYTKGLARRMLAFERLLERDPSLRKKVRFIQVVVPSRMKVDSYASLRLELDEIVGRINGAYASATSVPIHYMYRSVPLKQLVALYRAADVMLVTPLRDGMNLVAKEFVASREDNDGVLILSEFAGASAELAESIQVNPYDLDHVALSIRRALSMPAEERRTRMQALRRRVQAYNCYHWAETFIGVLQSVGSEVAPAAASSDFEIEDLLNRLRRADELLLFLDYDGTLMPFAGTPDLAAPDAELKDLLLRLARRPGTKVHLLSGRSRKTIEQWFGDLPIGLHAEHGFWSRPVPEAAWEAVQWGVTEWKDKILPLLEQFTEETPGSLIEDKTTGVAWHYRMADPDHGARQAERLGQRLAETLRDTPAELLPGDKVIEARLRGVNKGIIASRLVSGSDALVLAMGDDRTDEDLFNAMPPTGVTIHVGPNPSRAKYRLRDTTAARDLLSRLLDPQTRNEELHSKVSAGV
jgi:trehalose 6-phosphate synthase/phosphatase